MAQLNKFQAVSMHAVVPARASVNTLSGVRACTNSRGVSALQRLHTSGLAPTTLVLKPSADTNRPLSPLPSLVGLVLAMGVGLPPVLRGRAGAHIATARPYPLQWHRNVVSITPVNKSAYYRAYVRVISIAEVECVLQEQEHLASHYRSHRSGTRWQHLTVT